MHIAARCAAFMLAVVVVGCSSDATGPSSTDATIQGTVHSAVASSSAIRVAVSGTGVETLTASNGRFTLNGVTPGSVTLLFEGTSVDGSLPLGLIRAGDRVTIAVTINGSNVRLDSRNDAHAKDDEDDDDDEDELEGRIANLRGACPNVTFEIQLTGVRTTDRTKFEGVSCTALANGMTVEAEGTFANGVLQATKIERE
jgi:hypothetical protein